MKVKVKICGIRSLETAQAAISSGADFIGFNFVPSSKRYLNPEICRTLIDHIRGKAKIVGVFQDAPFEEVNRIADMLALDLVQLHGNEDDSYIGKVNRPVIKSITIQQKIKTGKAIFLLLDRAAQGRGDLVDFEQSQKLTEQYKIFFAGGLTPENVTTVVKKVKPFAVDVAGGIETNGREDIKKIKLFIKRAKGVTI